MGIITHAALRRAMAVNARATREVGTRRVVGMQGSGRVVIVESESCGGIKAIANSSGLAFGPNAQVLVAERGGQAVEVIGSPPSGAGSALPPREVAKTVGPGPAPESIAGYIGIREITATSMEVHRFDADGVFASTVGSKSIGSGLFPRAGHWGVIRGDDTFEDGSLIFARRVTGTNELKIQTLDIGTNTLHTHTIVTDAPTGPTSRVTPAVRGLDYHKGKIYFARLITDTAPTGKNRDVLELYSANPDLTGVTLQGTLAPDFSTIPDNRTHNYWAWCRVGDTIQVPRQLNDPLSQIAIDSMGLDGSDPTFDLTRTGTLPLVAFGDNQWRASAHGDDRGYILSFANDTPPPTIQEIELHSVGLDGDTVRVWPNDYIQTRSDSSEFNIVASTGGGVVAAAMIQAFGTSSTVERFNVTEFGNVPAAPVIQDIDLGGEAIDVFLGV